MDSGEYRGPPFVAGPRPGPKVSGFLKYIQKALKFRGEVTIEHLLGKRVEVYWAGSRVSKRWKSATVESTSLAQWFNKYHVGLEVMGSIPMGDFHI